MFGMGTGVSLLPSSPHINYTTFNLIFKLILASLRVLRTGPLRAGRAVLLEPDGLINSYKYFQSRFKV